MKVRKYLDSDFEELIKLYKNKPAYGGNYDAQRDERDRLNKTSGCGNLFVVENENREILGSAMILDNPHTFWLLRFAVNPEISEYQSVCELLMKKLKVIAKERGHSSIIVYTDPADAKLNARYTNLDFNKGGEYRCYWIPVENQT